MSGYSEELKRIETLEIEENPDGTLKISMEIDFDTLTAFAKIGILAAMQDRRVEFERSEAGLDLSEVSAGEVLKDTA